MESQTSICRRSRSSDTLTQRRRHSGPRRESYTYSLVGSTTKEDTRALRLATRRERSAAYTGLDADRRMQRKRPFEDDPVPSVQRMHCVAMKLHPQQHQALRLWFKDARWTYNCALRLLLKKKWHKSTCITPTNEMEALLVRTFEIGRASCRERV